MKRYKWIEHFENRNNRGYSLHDTQTGKNIAWISENNRYDYTIYDAYSDIGGYRYPHELADAMQACLESSGIDPADVELFCRLSEVIA